MKKISLLLIAVISILTLNARPNTTVKYWRCTYLAGSGGCDAGAQPISCGWEYMTNGKTPCETWNYYYKGLNGENIKGECCDGLASVYKKPVDINNIEYYPSDDNKLMAECAAGPDIVVYDFDNDFPLSWNSWSVNVYASATTLTIEITERDPLNPVINPDQTQNIVTIPLSLGMLESTYYSNCNVQNKTDIKSTVKGSGNALQFSIKSSYSYHRSDLEIQLIDQNKRNTPIKVSVFSIDGRLIHKKNIKNEISTIKLDRNSLPNGILVITISDGIHRFSRKIIN